jgi:uncharacterized damage-inducible protein DinB
MTFVEHYLSELDREAQRTRRVLEAVPQGHDDWKPHDKSMPFARLAGLVASMPSWINLIVEQDELDLTPPPGSGEYRQPQTAELVRVHDEHVAKARSALVSKGDEFLRTTKWSLRAGGQVVMSEARDVVLRDTMNHLAHHRGQLTVYLRLLGVRVPSVYGPSADDPRFL